MICFRRVLGILVIVCFVAMESSYAVETGARGYQNIPIGLNTLQLIQKNTDTTGFKNIAVKSTVLRYFRAIDIFGHTALIGGYIPYTDAALDIPVLGLNLATTGMADPALIIGMGLYGLPALSRDEFKHYQQATVVATSVVIKLPLGKYHKMNPLNLGENRWSFKPEIGVSHQFSDTGIMIESYLNYVFYTDNTQYRGSLTRQQAAKTGIDVHLVYAFMRGAYISADFFHKRGGEVKVNSVLKSQSVDDTTVGTTFKMAFSRSTALEIKYRKDTSTKSGDKRETAQLKLQYLW